MLSCSCACVGMCLSVEKYFIGSFMGKFVRIIRDERKCVLGGRQKLSRLIDGDDNRLVEKREADMT